MLKTQFDSKSFTLIIETRKGEEAVVYTLDDTKAEPVRLMAALKQYIENKGQPTPHCGADGAVKILNAKYGKLAQ